MNQRMPLRIAAFGLMLSVMFLQPRICLAGKDAVVETKQGKLRGTTEGNVSVWKGITYAKAPVGSLRFKAPQPTDNWTGTKDALKFSAVCPQKTANVTDSQIQDEDCLALNVYAPADGKQHPVMFWIHGGGFISGSGSSALYDGTQMASKGDVVIVTINYRLGPLGFLYFKDLPNAKGEFENNLGIKDQLAALKWVKENIAAFGGDPDAITLFGESAGAISVQTLMGMPSAKGLFKRAIVESGNADILWTPQVATQVTKKYLSILGISPDSVSQLKNVPTDTLMVAMRKLMKELIKEPKIMKLFAPTVDGDLIPQNLSACITAGQCQGIDLLIGTNKNEANLFALKRLSMAPTSAKELAPYLVRLDSTTKTNLLSSYKAYPKRSGIMSLLTDATFAIPSIRFAENQSVHANTYMYRFDWSSTMLKVAKLRACHGVEVPFVFGTFNTKIGKKLTFLANRKSVNKLSNNMQMAWINFAKTGNPNTTIIKDWHKYDSTDRNTMVFNKNIHTQKDPKSAERKAWAGIDMFQ